jgi:hypothetical protein
MQIVVLSTDDSNVKICNKFWRFLYNVRHLSHTTFAANKLVLSLEETRTIKFIMNISPHCVLGICYDEKYVDSI